MTLSKNKHGTKVRQPLTHHTQIHRHQRQSDRWHGGTEIQQARYSFNVLLKLHSLFNGALLHILSLLWQSVCPCVFESGHCNSLTAGSLSEFIHRSPEIPIRARPHVISYKKYTYTQRKVDVGGIVILMIRLIILRFSQKNTLLKKVTFNRYCFPD